MNQLSLIRIKQAIFKFTPHREYEQYQNIRNREFKIKFLWQQSIKSFSINDILTVKLELYFNSKFK